MKEKVYQQILKEIKRYNIALKKSVAINNLHALKKMKLLLSYFVKCTEHNNITSRETSRESFA